MTKEELEERLLKDMHPHNAYREDYLAKVYDVDQSLVHEAMEDLRAQNHTFEAGPMVRFNEPRWVRI